MEQEYVSLKILREESMGQNLPQLAFHNTMEISFGFCTSWTQSRRVWNSPAVRPILGQPAKLFACFIMLPFLEKELLSDKNFLPHRTSWSSRLVFRPNYVNPAGQTELLLLYPQPVLLERKPPAHTLLDETASQSIPLACTPEVFDLKSILIASSELLLQKIGEAF